MGAVTHLKFLLMHGTSSVYQDAFEQCRGPFSNWINSESEQFPDHEFKQVRIPVKSGKETEGVNDLDNAVKRFSLASDAFLLFGYSKEHRVIKTFAGDPLKADAVMYLQLMAMDLWGQKRGLGNEGEVKDMCQATDGSQITEKVIFSGCMQKVKGQARKMVSNGEGSIK